MFEKHPKEDEAETVQQILEDELNETVTLTLEFQDGVATLQPAVVSDEGQSTLDACRQALETEHRVNEILDDAGRDEEAFTKVTGKDVDDQPTRFHVLIEL